MKRLNQGIIWAVFLVLAGAFLLVKNLQLIDPWGEAAWGGLFAAAGLVFLGSFVLDPQQWWRAIPGFVLLSIGAPVLLAWQHVQLGNWTGSIVLFGMALAFWTALIARRENWWAEIPAGVLTVLGLLLGLQGTLRPDLTLWPGDWLAALYIGLGLVFALLYVLRLGERETWWPSVPAAGLILFGIVTWIGPLTPAQAVLRWWPAALILLGLAVLVLSIQRLPGRTPRPAAPERAARPATPDFEATPPARGASVTRVVPEAELPPAAAAAPRAAEAPAAAAPAAGEGEPAAKTGDVDIYEFLKNQPPEEQK